VWATTSPDNTMTFIGHDTVCLRCAHLG
jgi:hypothetical protein